MNKRFLRIPEAVAYSGQCRTALYNAHRDGLLPFVKFGSSTHIERKDLDAYLDTVGVRIEAA